MSLRDEIENLRDVARRLDAAKFDFNMSALEKFADTLDAKATSHKPDTDFLKKLSAKFLRGDYDFSRRELKNLPFIIYGNEITSEGVRKIFSLLDLTDEEPAMQQVSYLSQPFNLNQFMTTRLKRISWNVISKNIPEAENLQTMTLTLRGERGGSCHGYIISQVQAIGVVAAPLSRPIISIPSRTLRLQATACLTSSSLILPTIIQNT